LLELDSRQLAGLRQRGGSGPPFATETVSLSVWPSQNDLTFLRVRTTKNEVMIAPDKEFMLIVVQNPHAEDTATVAPLATAAAGASAFDDDE
tara:strand:+ start:115 stop:390 length:276 start_codon:yes stop_codon:yes gene_type:complete